MYAAGNTEQQPVGYDRDINGCLKGINGSLPGYYVPLLAHL